VQCGSGVAACGGAGFASTPGRAAAPLRPSSGPPFPPALRSAPPGRPQTPVPHRTALRLPTSGVAKARRKKAGSERFALWEEEGVPPAAKGAWPLLKPHLAFGDKGSALDPPKDRPDEEAKGRFSQS